jgi:hypothetical protein
MKKFLLASVLMFSAWPAAAVACAEIEQARQQMQECQKHYSGCGDHISQLVSEKQLKACDAKRKPVPKKDDAKWSMTPAICFVKITKQNAEKLMTICGDLSDCFDRPGECAAIERDRQAHVKAGRLVCDNKDKEKCKLAPNPYAEKDYIWDCASYRWKWEDRSFGRSNGYKTLADACVKRPCRWLDNWAMCAGGNLGYVPRKLRRQQLRDLGRVPSERYVKR